MGDELAAGLAQGQGEPDAGMAIGGADLDNAFRIDGLRQDSQQPAIGGGNIGHPSLRLRNLLEHIENLRFGVVFGRGRGFQRSLLALASRPHARAARATQAVRPTRSTWAASPGPGWTEFLAAELAVVVLVELLERLAGAGDLLGRQLAIAVGVECLHHGVHAHRIELAARPLTRRLAPSWRLCQAPVRH